MKKKLLIAVTGIIVLGLIALGLLVLNINPILEKLKPRIAETISDSIGQPVTLGKISAQFFPSVAIEINDVALKEAPEQASVETLLLDTSIAALLKGEVEVSELAVRGAKASIIRQKDGSLALGSLALGKSSSKSEENSADSGGPASPAAPSAESGGDTAATQNEEAKLALKLKSAALENIRIEWIDKSVSPEARVAIEDLEAAISNVSSDSDGTISLSASVLGTKPNNLSVRGTASLAKTAAGIPKTDITLKLESLDLQKIQTLMASYGAAQEELRIGEDLSYEMQLTVDNSGIRIRPKLDAANADIAFGDAFRKPKGVALAFQSNIQPSLLGAVTAETLSFQIAGINVSAPFSFSPTSGTTANISTPSLPLAELGKLLPAAEPFNLGGDIDASIKLEVPPPGSKGGLPAVDGTISLESISAMLPRLRRNSDFRSKRSNRSHLGLRFF